jgi:putative ABC transport system permease protein
MLKSYFTMAWRNLRRSKVLSFINIGGLMIGLSTCTVMSLIITFMITTDRFHKNYQDIYMLEFNQDIAGHIETSRSVPAPLAPVIAAEIPALKYIVRTTYPDQSVIRYGNKALYQSIMYTEPDFFNMMTFPTLQGNAVSSLQENSVVITESTAKRLFGTEDALNKTIVIDNVHPYKVGAVVRDVPDNSTITFDLILPFKVFEHDNDWASRWENHPVITWLQLSENTNVSRLNTQLNQVLHHHSEERNVSTFAYPLSRLILFDNFRDGKPSGGKIYLVSMLGVLAVFVLLIACVNFINLSTAMADRRAKEVGLRKVLGATRGLLIGQFMGEAMLISVLALMTSIVVTLLVLPLFEASLGTPDLYQQYAKPGFWMMLFVLGIFTGVIAGIYPALYLTRFQPAKVLTRIFSSGRKGAGFRQALVTFQFVISIFFIIGVIVVFRQIKYLRDRPMGYDISHLVAVTADGDLPQHFDLFKEKLNNIPNIAGITAESDNLVGIGSTRKDLDWPGKTPDRNIVFHQTWVHYNWTKTIGLQMAEGRDFDPAFGADTSACLINETALRRMGLKQAVVGAKIDNHTIIGVTRDFVYNNPSYAVAPLIIYLRTDGLNNVLVRLDNAGKTTTTLTEIEKAEKSINPFYPFAFHFLEDAHQRYFVGHFKIEGLVNLFGTIAILLSCLGLFGLAGFIAERRAKEISIRKILGAGPGTIWLSLSKEFLKPVFIGFIIGSPLAALALAKLLSSTSDYHLDLSWWIFAVAGAATLLIALATVSYHGLRAARINPARSLQTE